MRAVLAVACVVSCLGCRPEFELAPSNGHPAGPRANAGIGTSLQVDTELTLDGTGSFDPDGTIVRYYWSVVSAPPDRQAQIVDSLSPVTTITPDVPGQYTFELAVTDDAGLIDLSRVTFTVLVEPLAIEAGSDVNAEWRATVQLSGTVMNATTDVPAIAWRFVSKPARSAITLTGPSTLTPWFFVDAEGTYVLELHVSTSMHDKIDTLTVVATAPRVTFDGDFIDAEYHAIANYFVLISDSPPRVRFINPDDATEVSIPLPATPTSLSVEPTSARVMVAHGGQVSVLNAFSLTLDETFDVPFPIFDIVFGASGSYVHLFPTAAGPVQTMELGVNGTVPSTGTPLSGRNRARLHPSNDSIYVVDTATAADDLHRMDASAGSPIAYLRDSPYTGQYPMGGDLWFSEDGTSIFVRGGGVFVASDDPVMDMTYRGRLAGDEPAIVQWATGIGSKVMTVHDVATNPHSSQLRVYDTSSLSLLNSAAIPDLIVNGTPQRGTGRIIAVWPNIMKTFVLVSAGSSNAIFTVQP